MPGFWILNSCIEDHSTRAACFVASCFTVDGTAGARPKWAENKGEGRGRRFSVDWELAGWKGFDARQGTAEWERERERGYE